eukprot:CAMPEP_0172850466 /NCGR_PEP_ID=MMETSP1075-20121228/49088_1 /TAXON_ID=2916 /ORGANISM="Ceratium fusus, Strain PA161109" /LENGTH=30 /DNA_ID= /DNA_START= /DNA_END= /DNA_ORIENTATION=
MASGHVLMRDELGRQLRYFKNGYHGQQRHR